MNACLNLSFEIMARAGLFARAIVYALIASLLVAAIIAPGTRDEGYSPGDTFRQIEQHVPGFLLLAMIAAGLFLYAIWRGIQAVFDTSDKGDEAMGRFARLGMMSSGISYLTVGFAALLVILDQDDQNGGGTTETLASYALSQMFGKYLLMLGGLIVLAIGVAQVWRAVTHAWKHDLKLPSDSNIACALISSAIAGRGLLIMLVGVFLVWAGWVGDADEARGIAGLLGWLRDQPFGLILYALSATSIASYGFYSLVEARYMKISL